MFCMQCGAKLPDNAKFCFQCGAKVQVETEKIEPTEKAVGSTPKVIEIKLGNRNLEFPEEIKFKSAQISYYKQLTQKMTEEFSAFYQGAQIKTMADVLNKVFPFYENQIQQTIDSSFERILSMRVYNLDEKKYRENVQDCRIKGDDPLGEYYKYRREHSSGIKGTEKLSNPVQTKNAFLTALQNRIYVLQVIEAQTLVQYGVWKDYNVNTNELDTRIANIRKVLNSILSGDHTNQAICKAYNDLLEAEIDGIQANPFKRSYYAEIFDIEKKLKKYGNCSLELFSDLFSMMDFFDMKGSCRGAISQITKEQMKPKLEELHKSPDKASELYPQLIQILNDAKDDNPIFDLADFKDELNQMAEDRLKPKLEELHKVPDQILTLYPVLIRETNEIKTDNPFYDWNGFMEHIEYCKNQILEHMEFCEKYSYYTEQVMQGKTEEVLKAADFNDGIAQYVFEKYYQEVILKDAIESYNVNGLSEVVFGLEKENNESDFREYLKNLFKYEMYGRNLVKGFDKYGVRNKDEADWAVHRIYELANKRKPYVAAVAWMAKYYLKINDTNSALPYLKSAAEQHHPGAMSICAEALCVAEKDDWEALEKGYNYLRSSVFAGEEKALEMNKKYNLSYPINRHLNIETGKYSKITTQKCFEISDGTIKMVSFPRVLVNKYRSQLCGLGKACLFNNGKALQSGEQLKNTKEACKIQNHERVYLAISVGVSSHFRDGMKGLAIGVNGFYGKEDFLTRGCIPWEEFAKTDIFSKEGLIEEISGGLAVGRFTFILSDKEEGLLCCFLNDLKNLCKDSLEQDKQKKLAMKGTAVPQKNQRRIIRPANEEEFKQQYDRFRVDALQGNILKLWNAANANDPIAQYALRQYYLFDILEEAIRKDEEKVFSVVLQEVETIGKRSDYAVYLKNELEYERKYINGRTSRYGIDKNMQEIIELAKKENACIAAVAEAGRYLCLFDNDELVKKGRKYLEDSAEQCEPSAMVNYGEYLIKQSEQGIAVDRQCAARYIKLAVYAQERYALFLNNHYKFGYERSGLREFHILEDKRSFIDDGSIRMMDFPNTLYVHYGTRFKAWPEDVLMNGGKSIGPSQKLDFARESFEIPSKEKIYFVLAANIMGHFKKNMAGFAVGTKGVYFHSVWGAGLVPWDDFCDEDIYIDHGVHVGRYTVIGSGEYGEYIVCRFLEDLQSLSRIPVGAGSELVDEIRRGEEFEEVKQENEKEPQGKVENKELPPSESRKITIDVQQKAAMAMAEVSQNEKYCPVCKKINKSTAKFCAGCGYDFSEERICKECGNKIRPGKKFCSACGAKVED